MARRRKGTSESKEEEEKSRQYKEVEREAEKITENGINEQSSRTRRRKCYVHHMSGMESGSYLSPVPRADNYRFPVAVCQISSHIPSVVYEYVEFSILSRRSR